MRDGGSSVPRVAMTDYDPRLVELYDLDNPDGPDHDFYRALADDVSASSVLDIGCGTGILTVTLAEPDRTVVGIDPSASMLRYAVGRPGAGAVRWIRGDSSAIPSGEFDYAIMTGNVAQHIFDPAWSQTLLHVQRALRTGGVLAFESRNPRVRAWDAWATDAATVRPTSHGPLQEWLDVSEQPDGLVVLTAHHVFERTSEHIVETQTLAFRHRNVIEQQLLDAGMAVDAVWGDWSRNPSHEDSPIMVFQARKP